jgi:hypothetical protein
MGNNVMIKLFYRILFFILLSYIYVGANIIHVPADFSTIQKGINAATAGDTVLIANGQYLTDSLKVDKHLVIASNYILSRINTDIENTIIQATALAGKEWFLVNSAATNSKIIGLRIEGNNQHSLGIENGYTEITHCQFINGKDQLSFEGSTSTPAGGYVGYCYFEGAGDDAIDCDKTTNWIIEFNTIINAHQDAIEVRLQDKSGPLTTHIFRFNTIINSGESGIQFINYPENSFRKFEVYGNIFKNCLGAGVSCMYNTETTEDYKGSDMEERAIIYNNTFVGCNFGLTMAPHIVCLNNIFTDSQSKAVGVSEYVSNENDHSIVDYCNFHNNPVNFDDDLAIGVNILNVPPRFVDTTKYELLPSSECVDRGCTYFIWEGDTALSIPTNRYFGAAPDLGASEYMPSNTLVNSNLLMPTKCKLYQNFPNPFNPQTRIHYYISEPQFVTIDIFNLMGRLVQTIKREFHNPGNYSVDWKAVGLEGSPLPSGIYLCNLRAGPFNKLIKMTLID